MLFSCGHVLQKMTSQGKSGWPILWMWRNLLPQATLSFLNKIMNAVDYSISQQQKPTMSLQKGTIISRLPQLFGGSLIKLDHPHHRGSNVFFLILISLPLNFLYRMQCCCQNYHLHSTSWYPTHFFLYYYGTHTHHRQKKICSWFLLCFLLSGKQVAWQNGWLAPDNSDTVPVGWQYFARME